MGLYQLRRYVAHMLVGANLVFAPVSHRANT